MRILILGGTAEAFALSEQLAACPGTEVVLSLAGRTREPRQVAVPTRIGGFGGAEGLIRWLDEHRTDLVVDATHPFAAIISRNAATACRAAGRPLLAVRRPPWIPQEGDRWTMVATVQEAVAALGDAPRRVFLTVGRLELEPFNRAPGHRYLVRTIEAVDGVLSAPDVVTLQARGPFDEASEAALMREHEIDVLVTKNSGGPATYGKLAAARSLGIPVILLSRPHKPDGPKVETVAAAMAWIARHGRSP